MFRKLALIVIPGFLVHVAFAHKGQQQPVPTYIPAQLVAAPDLETARKFAVSLVEAKYAVTVNIISNVILTYIWDGTVRERSECLLLIYTHTSQYKNIERFIRENHVHIEPGIGVFPIVSGSETYLKWLHDITVGEKENKL